MMDFLGDDGFEKLFPTEIEAIKWLVDCGVFHRSVKCPSCSNDMVLILNDRKKVFRCAKASCGHRELSYRFGSVFCGSRLKIRKILRVARCWLLGVAHGSAVISTGLNAETVRTWYSAFRELVSTELRGREDRIGGPGIIVEVDETLLGRRKYNVGHHVEGAWTMVGIERTTQRRAFCRVVERRDAQTIRSVIQ